MLNSTAPTTLKNLSRTPNHQDTKGLPDYINYICLPLELCHSASEESSPHLLAITIYVSSASENGCQLGGYAGGAGAGGPLWFPTFEAKTCVQLDSFKALSEYRITRMKNRVNVNGHPGTGWHPQIMPFKWGSWGLLVWAPKAPRERWTWRFKEKPRFLPLKTRELVPQESTFGPKGPCQGNRVEFHVSNMWKGKKMWENRIGRNSKKSSLKR